MLNHKTSIFVINDDGFCNSECDLWVNNMKKYEHYMKNEQADNFILVVNFAER